MTPPVRLGLLGAGRWGRTYLRSFEDVPGAVLARLFTRNPQTPAPIPTGCEVSRDWREVATADDLDGVVIATPAGLHAAMARVALGAGRAVLVEKPLALTRGDCHDLIDLARSRGAVLLVDHVDLYNPAWVALKEHVAELGPIAGVEATFGDAGPYREDVPPRWDWGPHPVALCLDLLGAPVSLRARRPLVRRTEAGLQELVEIDLEFDGGAACRIATGNGFDHRERRVVVRGERAALVYDDAGHDKLVRIVEGQREPLAVGNGRPLSRALTAFADAIRAERPDWNGAALGAAVVGVLADVDVALGCAEP